MAPNVYSLVGDSNVKRNMNPTNCRDRPLMSTAQVIPCTKLPVFRQSLQTVKSEANVCLISCVTNFLCDSTVTSSSTAQRVEGVLKDFFEAISDACKSFPERRYLVCPPMYRKVPLWFRDGLPEVLTSFSSSFARSAVCVPNLIAMPGFPAPDFESDGIHLTPYSGMEFVLHLFDRAEMLIANSKLDIKDREPIVTESARSLVDQVIALQQDHRRLSTSFELKTAIDAELACFRANERSEDSILITGVEKLPSGLTGKEWQERARKSVEELLKLIISDPVQVLVVHNATGRGVNAVTSYTCQLESVEKAQEIRRRFGRFFAGGKDSRPPGLSGISVSNVVTKETRVRIAVMKALGKKYLTSNPGSKVQVIGYNPRPILRLTPPPEATDRRPKSFNYIEAVQKLSKTLIDSELRDIATRAAAQFPGKLRELFVILSDDMVSRGRSSKRVREAATEEEPPSQRRAEEDE